MDDAYSVKLSKIIDEFKLETFYLPDLPENILISCSRVNRPGLQMVGFYDHYEQARLQIIGKVENLFIQDITIKTEEDPDVKPYFNPVKMDWVIIDMSPELEKINKSLEKALKIRLKTLKNMEL